MTAFKRLFVALVALSLPLAGLAQEAPKAPTITPYGFMLLNAFWDGGTFAAKDYPGQAALVQNQGGTFLMSARQSRVGFKLAMNDENWTGAALTGVVEFDFKAGHMPACSATACTAPVGSNGWNAGVMRLRLASGSASWKLPTGTFTVLAGQDYGLVNPLFATSVAWIADPIFWQAGNLWRRSPQIRATYAGQYDAIGVNLAVAMLSPADGDGSIDAGSGERSRTPDIEARLAGSFKTPDVNATLGVGYHTNKRRYSQAGADAFSTATAKTDVTASLLGVDLDVSVPYVQLKGEWYDGKGADETYNAIIGRGVAVATTGQFDFTAIKNKGYWAQLILKPIDKVWITAGIGQAEITPLATTATTQRKKNQQVAGGIILNAGKYWKVGLESCQTSTTYNDATSTKKDALQTVLSSQLIF